MAMIKPDVKEDVKDAKNCFMSLKLENFVSNVPEWSQKNKRILKFISPNSQIIVWEME